MQPQGDNAASSPSKPQDKKGRFWASVGEWVKVIVIALIIAIPIRTFIAEPFVVQGASMDPTFDTGQFLIVDRLTYDFRKPERGDVIVFEYPNDTTQDYIKRVIGLPGETLSIKGGKISIQESPSSTPVVLDEPYIESQHISYDDFASTTLGPTQYFVMGDNRAQSSDSRSWGLLDYHFIIGRPVLRLSPLSAISALPGQYHEETPAK
jgi:signal peptidase I